MDLRWIGWVAVVKLLSDRVEWLTDELYEQTGRLYLWRRLYYGPVHICPDAAEALRRGEEGK